MAFCASTDLVKKIVEIAKEEALLVRPFSSTTHLADLVQSRLGPFFDSVDIHILVAPLKTTGKRLISLESEIGVKVSLYLFKQPC
jgi:hypothetical protein